MNMDSLIFLAKEEHSLARYIKEELLLVFSSHLLLLCFSSGTSHGGAGTSVKFCTSCFESNVKSFMLFTKSVCWSSVLHVIFCGTS